MAFMSTAQAAQLSDTDNTDKYKRQLIANGAVGTPSRPELAITPYGGLKEYESEAFTVIYDTRSGTEFRVRIIEAPRYMAKVVPSHDPSGLQQGLPLYSDTPISEGAAEVISPSVLKPRRKRRRRRGRGNKTA